MGRFRTFPDSSFFYLHKVSDPNSFAHIRSWPNVREGTNRRAIPNNASMDNRCQSYGYLGADLTILDLTSGFDQAILPDFGIPHEKGVRADYRVLPDGHTKV